VTQPDPTPSPSPPAPVHDLADRFVDDYAAAARWRPPTPGSPATTTGGGTCPRPGSPSARRCCDGPAGRARRAPPATDRWDQLGVRVLREHLDLELADHEQGEPFLDIAHLGSTVPTMREVLDAQDTATEEDREAGRPAAGDLRRGARRLARDDRPRGRRGLVVAQRQVDSVAEQLRSAVDDRGSLTRPRPRAGAGAPVARGPPRPGPGDAREASEEVARWLEQVYRPDATERDGVGPERYERFVRRELRTTIDPAEPAPGRGIASASCGTAPSAPPASSIPRRDLPEVMHRLKVDPRSPRRPPRRSGT
jgi:hypothetical protein